MRHLDTGTIGAPKREHRHPRVRGAIAVLAATAGAVAVLVVGFIVITGTGPAESLWPYIALPPLVAFWLSGLWWRWDSPDHRRKTDERARRGF